MTGPDGLLDGLADGLRRRVAERGRAESRLADFVFHEGVGADPVPLPVEPSDWRYFVSRTLVAAGEPGTLDLLDRLSSGEQTLETLADNTSARSARRLGTLDRIDRLASAGLARRDLETGRVALTGLGSAVLAFAREWERRAAGPAPAGDGGST